MDRKREINVAYAAGFIDGEGTVCIDKRSAGTFGRKTATTYLKVEAAQIEPEPLDKLKVLFGGFVKYSHADRNLFRWRVSGRGAYEALMVLRPYLIIKRREADVAIAYWERRRSSKKTPFLNSKITLSLEEQLTYREALKDLKRERPKRYLQALVSRPELLPRKRQVKTATYGAAGQPR